MNEYKCPKCKSPLVYHHEDKETVTFDGDYEGTLAKLEYFEPYWK